MFYDPKIAKCLTLGEVWKAGTFKIENSGENSSIRDICLKLDTLIASDEDDVHSRMSLRTSSVMINGTAKILKKQADKLIADLLEMDREITERKNILRSIDNNATDSSDSEDEENRPRARNPGRQVEARNLGGRDNAAGRQPNSALTNGHSRTQRSAGRNRH